MCDLCNNIGWRARELGPAQYQLVPCVCMEPRLAAAARARLQETSNLIGDLVNKRFSDYRPDRTGQQEALEKARRFAASPAGWLVLVGTNGVGKTHLAAAIANDLLARDKPVLFVVVPDLLDHLRSTYGPTSAVSYDARFEEIRTAPVLILDDLGAESKTEWAAEKLFQIINYRYNLRAPTVITTNIQVNNMTRRLSARLGDEKLSTIVRVDVGALLQDELHRVAGVLRNL